MNETAFPGRTQEETQALNQELEHRIAERTRELADANRCLQQEIARHLVTEQELLESNARLKLAEAAARAQAERIENHRKVLLELAQLDEPNFELALEKILAADCEALDVERVSYWNLAGAPLKSEREMLYLKSHGGIARDETLLSFDAAHYPRYFAALQTHRPIVAHRAQTDPASSEFTEAYLKPHGITSMLDVAVWSQGEIVGVLCHSHVGAPREWSAEEVKFATAIANIVTLALEAVRRRELTHALIQSEEKYRLVVEHAAEGIFVTQDALIRFVNPRCAEFFGAPAGDILSRPLEEFIHADDRARVLGNYHRRVRGEVIENNYVFRTLDSRSLQINAVAIEWEGRPATLSFVSDVSERVRLHEDLARTLTEREVILETAVAGLVFVQNGRINWINAVFEQEFLGYAKGELVGQRGEIVFPSHERFKTFLSVAVPAIEQGSTYEIEVELKRKDGSLFWGLFSGRAINSTDSGKGSIWYLIDVTERRNMREDLQKTLIEREAILQSTLVGITFSIGRRHVWINQKFADMLGYQTQELIGQVSVMHFPSRESFEEFGKIAYPILEQRKSYATEIQMKRKDGSLIWCQLYGTSIVAGHPERGSIWTFVDITELKRALDKEKELSALKSRFVSMTSHEFRTPLATILSATELVENYGERLPATEKSELIALIKGAVKHMTHMLEQVLLIGKADAGRLDFNPQRLDFKAFCRRLVGELSQTDDMQHRLVFNHEGLLATHVFDERLVRHMLSNLVGNALKYSPAKSEVRLSVTHASGEIRIEVSDQGIGIAPEDQPNLFHSFQRGRNVSNISGTGLGLAIVKKAVNLHGGTIEFKSELERGTTFTVILPVAKEP
ncbi:MAG: PAS domain S-box protein [Burkholderiales bacterium]